MLSAPSVNLPEARYRGLRMNADEYLALPEDSFHWYELVDGVVCLSPSRMFCHQAVITEITFQLHAYLKERSIGQVVPQVDVKLDEDLVYRPDVVFVSTEKASRCSGAVTETPDIVVEVVSPDSRSYDSKTKRGDYEAAGIGEYWVIDPQKRSFQFLVNQAGRFEERAAEAGCYRAAVLPGFELDLVSVEKLF